MWEGCGCPPEWRNATGSRNDRFAKVGQEAVTVIRWEIKNAKGS